MSNMNIKKGRNYLSNEYMKALFACTAYESGFGKGLYLEDNHPSQSYANPYVKDSFEYNCYEIGFNEGKSKNPKKIKNNE